MSKENHVVAEKAFKLGQAYQSLVKFQKILDDLEYNNLEIDRAIVYLGNFCNEEVLKLKE